MHTNNSLAGSYLTMLPIVFFTVALLYFGKALFIPLLFSLFSALILNHFCNRLEKHQWPFTVIEAIAYIIETGRKQKTLKTITP
jgi:predicted PurR-regulated permease PerM